MHRVNRIQTHSGTLAIEGNTPRPSRLRQYWRGNPSWLINEVQEVRNALKAYELLDVLDPHKVDDLLKTHATMEAGLIDDAGRFRRGGAGVAAGNQIIHYAPDAERVPYLVDDLFEWLRTTEEHPLIASCVFHYEFEFIHPFADGNGRTGRLWQTLILSRWRPIFKNLPIENIVYKYQQDYYRAIAMAAGGMHALYRIYFRGSCRDIDCPRSYPKTTRERIVDEIRKNPKISRRALAKAVGITPDGVKYHLQKLTKAGVIRHVGATCSGKWVICK